MRALLLGFLLVACTPKAAPTRPQPPVAAPSASAPTKTSAVSTTIGKGKTVLHPLLSSSWIARDRLVLGSDTTLYVGASGERWVVTLKPAPTADDPEATKPVVTGATSFAPETLVAVRRRGQGMLLVGESGSAYPVNGPLDPLTTRIQPKESLRGVAVGKDALVGVTHDGRVLRSLDDGNSWSPVALPPSNTLPLSIAGTIRGELGLLAAPGRLLGSFDDGATFQVIKADGFGPIRAMAGSDDRVWITGRDPSTLAERRARLGVALEHVKSSAPPLARPAPEGDDELALGDGVRNGVAAWTGLRYVELRPLSDESELFHAVLVDKGVVTRGPPIAGTKGCEMAGVAAAGDWIVAECVRDDVVTVLKSADAGKTFVVAATLAWGDRMPHHLLVSPKGSIALDGACLKKGAADCAEGLLVQPAGQKSFIAAKLPKDRHLGLLQMNDDLVVATATDDDAASHLLVSKDGGRTFGDQPIADLPNGEVTELALDGKTVLAIDDDRRLLTRDEGATWESATLPFTATWISLAGARGLATANDGRAWETRDHGKTWGAVTLPPAESKGGTLPIACSELGCILGDVAIREGWEEPSEPFVPPNATAEVPHLPLLECTTSGEGIDLGDASRPELEPTPTIAWMTVAETGKGDTEVVVGPRGGKPLQHVALLAATKTPSAVRRVLSPEGALVIRIAREAEAGKKLVDVEVAAWIAATNKVFRATFRETIAPLGKWGQHYGVATLVPGHGALVRIGASSSALGVAHENGTTTKLSLPSGLPSSVNRWYGQRKGAVTTLFGVPGSYQGERVIAFAAIADVGPPRTWSWGVWPRTSARVAPTVTFGGASAFVEWPGSEDLSPRAFSLAIGDVDPPEPIALPSARELADAKPCTDATGPRIELGWSQGARRPIVVDKGSSYHATMSTLGRGNKAGACLSATLAGTSDNAWMVLSADSTSGLVYLRNRKPRRLVPVSCHESKEKLPSFFASMPGFRAP